VSKETTGAPGAEEKGAAGAAEKQPRAEKAEKQPRAEKQAKGASGAEAKGAGAKTSKGQKPSEKPAQAAKGKPAADPPGYKPRLKKLYLETAAKDLREEFGYTSPMQVPRLTKIVVSMGLGEAIANKKILDAATQERRSRDARPCARARRSPSRRSRCARTWTSARWSRCGGTSCTSSSTGS
jgi:hypothetical protein